MNFPSGRFEYGDAAVGMIGSRVVQTGRFVESGVAPGVAAFSLLFENSRNSLTQVTSNFKRYSS